MRHCVFNTLLKDKDNLIGAEIGVDRGDNSEGLLANLNIKKLYLIDPYIPYMDKTQEPSGGLVQRDFALAEKIAREKLSNPKVEFIKELSADAMNRIGENYLDFVYIDGSHDGAVVADDIRGWSARVKQGGIVGGHDSVIPDVFQSVIQFCQEREISFTVDPRDCEWFFIKK